LIASLPDGSDLVAVADGMGGHSGGEVASHRALEVLQKSLAEGVELPDAVQRANSAVFEEAAANEDRQGMGTTLVALLRQGDRYTVINVGDSRAYRLDGTGVRQLTVDHSFVAEAVRSGQLTAEDAERSRWRHAVTRAVGTEPMLEVDSFGPFDATEDHTVLLCSDGVHRVLADDAIRSAVAGASSPDGAVRALAAAAYDAGSDDNMSAVIVRFGGRRRRVLRARPKRRVPNPNRWTTAEIALTVLGLITVIIYLFILLGTT
jgi:protein phosphatase